MEENKNTGLNIDPQEFISSMQEIVQQNKGYSRQNKNGLKRAAKKTRKVRKPYLENFGNAVFLSNKQNNKREIVLSSSINPITVQLSDEAIKSVVESTEFPELKSNFIIIQSDKDDTIHPYQNISGIVNPEDDLYLYNEEHLDKIQSISFNNPSIFFFYQGNLFVNGKCYGSYRAHLENKAEIDLLKNQIKSLNDEITTLKETMNALLDKSDKAIYRSELDHNNPDLSYLWAGTEDDYNDVTSSNPRVKDTIFITAEE